MLIKPIRVIIVTIDIHNQLKAAFLLLFHIILSLYMVCLLWLLQHLVVSQVMFGTSISCINWLDYLWVVCHIRSQKLLLKCIWRLQILLVLVAAHNLESHVDWTPASDVVTWSQLI